MDVNISSTIGALFIGTICCTVLWGISCVQTWYYFDNFRDERWITTLVLSTWACDTIHEFLICHAMYSYLILHFGSETIYTTVIWSVYVEIFFNALTGLIVQSFFLHRIWQLRKTWWIILGIGLLIAADFLATTVYFIQAFAWQLNTFQKDKHLRPLSMSINVLSAVTDLSISAAICLMLNASKTGFSYSNSVLNRLILYSINTGLITSVCALCSLIFILALPNTLIYFGFYYVIGRLYTNSLLATLNGRKRLLRGSGRDRPLDSVTRSQERSTNFSGFRGKATREPTQIQVQIETVRNMHQDSDNMEHDADTHSNSNSVKTQKGEIFM